MHVSLRTLLISLNLIVLLLPLAGIQLLRIYESALVRQTESALIAQSAFIAAFYRSLILSEYQDGWIEHSIDPPSDRSAEAEIPAKPIVWVPRAAVLDLASSEIHDPFPDPVSVSNPRLSKNPQRFPAVTDRLNPTLKDAQLTTLAGIRVVDITGTIIASTGTDLGESIANSAEISGALEGRSVSMLRTKSEVPEPTALDSFSRTSRIRVFVSAPILLEDRIIGAVMLSRTPPSIIQALYGKRWLLGQSFLVVLTLVVLMSLIAHRLITRPIERIVSAAEDISHGRIHAHQKLARRDPAITEFIRLQHAISKMAESLEARAEYLQNFVRHISHEFKTPLAGIKGATELIEEHGENMQAEQLRKFLQNITSDTDRLQTLTERLNQLTQAELRPLEDQPTHLTDIVASLQRNFTGLQIKADVANAGEVDGSHCSSALEILLTNAQQHGAKNVVISGKPTELIVENDGTPISAGNSDQLFTPFFTTRREQGGTGLGLSIAAALVAKMGADLRLANANPVQFTIVWPD
ncbi:MAG: HAMP domain-containing protein [Pseudomonadales bacterium]|nr:HAMP domain-containing protein [Pseudomonadales bacterium]